MKPNKYRAKPMQIWAGVPPMQAPSSYNLDAVIARIKAADANHPRE
jgi:hypothetical protein